MTGRNLDFYPFFKEQNTKKNGENSPSSLLLNFLFSFMGVKKPEK